MATTMAETNLAPIPLFNNIPLMARVIKTPLLPDAWLHKLRIYPLQDLVQYFIHSVTMGFRLGSNGGMLQSPKKNLKSATDHPNVVDDYLKKSYHLAGYLAHINHPHVPGFTSIDLVLYRRISSKTSGALSQTFLTPQVVA